MPEKSTEDMTERRHQSAPSESRSSISPLVLAISYVVYAGLWILASEWLLGTFVPAEQLARFGVIKGLAFVAVTGVILYLLLRWLTSDSHQKSANPIAAPDAGFSRRGPIITFFTNLAIVALVAGGTYLYRAPAAIESAQDRMADLTTLRADYIDAWLEDRANDAIVIQSSPSLRQAALLLASSPDDETETRSARQRAISHFNALRNAYGYEAVALLDANGTPLVNRGFDQWPQDLNEHIAAAADSRVVDLPPDLYTDHHAHIDWLVPIGTGESVSAYVLLRADVPPLSPDALHTSRTTFLARPSGDSVILLDEISRHSEDEPWPHLPWDQSPLKPADFAPGASPRSIEGKGVDGQPVVGVVYPLPGHSWAVVATQPRAMVLEPLYETLWLLAVVGFFFLAIIAVVLTLLWRRARESDALRWSAHAAEQDRLLRVFYDMPFFGMGISSTSTHRITAANPRLAEMLGQTNDSLIGKNCDELLGDACNEQDREKMLDLLSGKSDHFAREYSLTRRDGSIAHLRFDTRLTRSQDGRPENLVSIAEDVTREREAYRALEHQKDLYDLLSQANQAITRCHSTKELFDTACRVAVEHGHLAFAWIGLIDEKTGKIEPVAQFGDSVGYIESIEVSIHADEPAGKGPIGRAIRSGELIVMNQFQSATSTRAWHESAQAAGIDAVAAFPIRRSGQIIGAMALYAPVSGFFDEAIYQAVEDLATDISFAVEYFDRLEDLERAKQAVEASPAVLFRWRPETGWPVEYVSENIDRWGYDADDWESGGVHFVDYIHPEDVPHIAREVADHTENRRREFLQEYRLRMADGGYRWFEDVTRIDYDETGRVIAYSGVVTDVQERHEIQEREHLMAKVIENTREGVVITNRDQRIIEVNPAFTELTGYTAQQAIGRTPKMLASGQHDHAFYQQMWRELQARGYWQGEIWNRRRNGEIFPELLSISTVVDRDGEISHYVGLFVDISRQKENESKLDFLAHHDPLTGLPNRLVMSARLEQLIELAKEKHEQIAVLMIDLDRFKDVNDSLGHDVGDQLLIKVSERLKERFSQADTIARLGGDEFAMTVTGMATAEEIAGLAGKIISALGEPWELANGQQVRILASVGITLSPAGSRTPLALLQQADTALYRAKDEGRSTFRFFSDEMTDAARDRIGLELELRQAIDNDELRLVFQPQMHVSSNCLHGAEVLVRWQHPSEGLISPDRFIPVAETTGLIWPLGEWVLREACRVGRRWLDEGRDFGRLAVNVSPHQLRQGEVGQLVEKVLEETGLPADRLEIELTESAIVRRESEARELLDRLRTMGVHVALDDFGTGYSSLGQLRLFALDVLKIDKRFIDLIDAPSDRGQIARVIIDLGHTLGLKVLAEGVETAAQRRFLAEHRCDMYQGYLESRPLAPETFAERYLEQQQSRPAASDSP